MPALQGSQWSKDPLRDRREDELAYDMDLLDTLEIQVARLRSRMAARALLAQGVLPPQKESDTPRQRSVA